MNEKEFKLIGQIAERADELGILMFDRSSLIMDLKVANEEFNLRLDEFLKADNFNFSHDVVGIQRHIDRKNKKMTDTFLPRFSGKKS